MQQWFVRFLVAMAAIALLPMLAHCGGDDQPSCSDLQTQAAGPLYEAEQNASLACSVDADCMLGQYPLTCTDICNPMIVLAGSAVFAVEAAQKQSEDVCRSFDAKGCQVVVNTCGPPSLGARKAACRNGKCTIAISASE